MAAPERSPTPLADGRGHRAHGAPCPCPRCGFHAPELPCPHCGEGPLERSLRGGLRGPLGGLGPALAALPRGLWFVLSTPGIKRWLAAPFVGTLTLLVALWTWVFERFELWLAGSVPDEVRLEGMRAASTGWPGWLARAWQAVAGALEWLAGLALGLFAWAPVQWLGWFLLGSLVLWLVFSLVYEVLAGPFLDEVQARLEARWFGSDPRSRLARPNDLRPETAARWTLQAALGMAAVFLAVWWLPRATALAPPRWAAFALAPLGAVPWLLRDARYREWLGWALGLQGRALRASLQASLVTGTLIVLALPLYFVPVWGYPAFAVVTGFATAVGLLDIPFERRDWTLAQRWRFVRRHVAALTVFGTLAGLLLAIPVLGPLLLVPSASLGGAWLVCRLDKSALRDP